MAASTTAFTSAGTTIGIVATSAAPSTFDAAGYAAQTFVTIGEITDIGEFGRKYNTVTHNPIATRATIKLKGNYDDGEIVLQMARAPGDSGQAILKTAVDDDDSYSICVTLQDGTKEYTRAQINSYTTNVGSGDKVTTAQVGLSITKAIVEVAP